MVDRNYQKCFLQKISPNSLGFISEADDLCSCFQLTWRLPSENNSLKLNYHFLIIRRISLYFSCCSFKMLAQFPFLRESCFLNSFYFVDNWVKSFAFMVLVASMSYGAASKLDKPRRFVWDLFKKWESCWKCVVIFYWLLTRISFYLMLAVSDYLT